MRDGNVVVTGASTDSWGSPINAHSEDSHDVFVARLNTNGALLWNTFMGGASIDRGFGITVDGSGNSYVTGESHGTWGNPVNPPSSNIINQEVFVAKLNRNGARQWNTFMGDRNGDDIARAISFDMAMSMWPGTVKTVGVPRNGRIQEITMATPLPPASTAATAGGSGILSWAGRAPTMVVVSPPGQAWCM